MWVSDSNWLLVDSYEYDSFWNLVDFESSIWNTRLFTWREYDVDTGVYYNRARYYDPVLGRFISRDPIDVGDDVNLYRYVGNNGVKFVDLMGMEKSLIFLWEDYKWTSLIRTALKYQYNRLIKEWIKPKNIIIIDEWEITTNIINEELSKNIWNINEIIIISHWWKDWIGIEKNWIREINKNNINEINNINPNGKTDTEVTLISCNTWYWNESIWQDLSNQLWVNVVAPSNYVYVNSRPKLTDKTSDLVIWSIVYSWLSIFKDNWEPSLLFWFWERKNLKPNY